MIKQTLFLFFMLVFLNSCKNRADQLEINNSINFLDSDFKITQNLKSEELPISDSLYISGSIVIIDNYIFLNELKTDNFIHVVDLSSEKYIGKYGNKGKGPGEILSSFPFYKSQDGSLRVLDSRQKKIVEFNIDSLILENRYSKEYKLNVNVSSNSAIVYDDKIYTLDNNNLKARLFEFSFDGEERNRYINSNLQIIADDNELYLSDMVNYKNVFSFSSRYMPLIEIFDLNTNKWTSLIGPVNFKPTRENYNDRTSYNMIRMSEKFIYALYCGKQYISEPESRSLYANIIYVFDYHGSFVKKIILDEGIINFDIYKDDIIYGLGGDLTTKLLKFNINQ